jgi:Predicted DNA binding protein
VTDTGEDPLVELQYVEKQLTDYLADRGIRVLESTADPQSATFTLSVPDTVDLGTFFADLSDQYGDPELVAKSERLNTDTASEEGYRSRLTPRQREVLRTAHTSGFFESPRAVTGETVAEELGISPQTFYRHIRTAERKLFDTVFEQGVNSNPLHARDRRE